MCACVCICALSIGTQNTTWEGAGSGMTGRERGSGLALGEGILEELGPE